MAQSELQALAGWFEPAAPVSSESCKTRRDAAGLTEVHLAGRLPRDWSVRLTHACAERGIGLVRGHAHHLAPSRWQAQLKLDLGFVEVEPDFLEMATQPVLARGFVAPRLLDFELADSGSHGGCLLLEVHAWDGLGLLAAILGCAAEVGLHAEEFVLETEDEVAFQHLALQGDLRSRPSPYQARRLERRLDRLLVGG